MNIDLHVSNILRLLAKKKNVLLVGPPATGKSKIMSLVASKFVGGGGPGLEPDSEVPIPATGTLETWMPSSSITVNRKSFKINFHQSTKHRDFVSGIIPRLSGNNGGFAIMEGMLLKANHNAIDSNGASIVLVDEINRGPAVSIFGDTIASIEADKRLTEDNSLKDSSAPFYTYSTEYAEMKENHLSPHVYIIASMNEADTSVEPLDVAFLRRFAIYRLHPELEVVRELFQVTDSTQTPETATEPAHVLAALANAWKIINDKISVGKGEAYQIGHGILLTEVQPSSLEGALTFAESAWRQIESHIREVFYGNSEAQAFLFNANENGVYSYKEVEFGDQLVSKMFIAKWGSGDIYKMLLQVARNAES
jgi:5-methylcytosine-specific restriction protein B